MKKKTKVIELSGLLGIVFLVFCVVCLIAGFVVFPGLVAKSLWNMASDKIGIIPAINEIQGILLWGILALSAYLATGSNPFLSVKKATELDDEEMKNLMSKIREQAKTQRMNVQVIKSNTSINKVVNGKIATTEENSDKDKEKL